MAVCVGARVGLGVGEGVGEGEGVAVGVGELSGVTTGVGVGRLPGSGVGGGVLAAILEHGDLEPVEPTGLAGDRAGVARGDPARVERISRAGQRPGEESRHHEVLVDGARGSMAGCGQSVDGYIAASAIWKNRVLPPTSAWSCESA